MFAMQCLVAQFEAKRLLKNANEVEKSLITSSCPSCLIFVWKSVLKLFCHIFGKDLSATFTNKEVNVNPILILKQSWFLKNC